MFKNSGPTNRGQSVVILLLWLISLAAAFLGGVFAYRHRDVIRQFTRGGGDSSVVQTNLHNVRIEEIPISADGRDGGLAAVGNDVLLASRTGALSLLVGHEQRPLAVRVPINVDAFTEDPYNANTIHRELFGVKDLLVEQHGDSIHLLASHNWWYADEDCYAVRVSGTRTTRQALLTDGQIEWRTYFESTPCRPLTVQPDGEHRNPSLGAGGRMVWMGQDRILVTLGGLGPESDPEGARMARERDNSYGKTILVDLATGESRIWTMGHRNPQGLARGADGQVWLTEHGARGGDELNRLREGGDYGYPVVSYGTAYESMEWPGNPRQGRHDGFDKPTFVWTPGIGISQLIVLGGRGFPHWQGDLIVASLGGGSLFRVRVEDGRAVFAEQLSLGHRIRDIVETADGSIVVKTDDDLIFRLLSLEATTADPSTLTPAERGAALAYACQGCHALTSDGGNRIGPPLGGVVGRRIAAVDGYGYSEALRTRAGRWTEETLAAFIARPDSFAPGTTMQVTSGLQAEQISDLVAYLETLR